jgi:hypothetical protein
MTEDEVAKIAFAAVVTAINELRADMSSEDCERFVVGFPGFIEVNGNRYEFIKIANPTSAYS